VLYLFAVTDKVHELIHTPKMTEATDGEVVAGLAVEGAKKLADPREGPIGDTYLPQRPSSSSNSSTKSDNSDENNSECGDVPSLIHQQPRQSESGHHKGHNHLLPVPQKPEDEKFEGGPVKPATRDILCGRGGLSNTHPGNAWFRTMIRVNRPLYKSSAKHVKLLVAKSIVRHALTQKPPCRFLERKSDGPWYKITNKRAIDKTSQALRERERYEHEPGPEELEKLRKKQEEANYKQPLGDNVEYMIVTGAPPEADQQDDAAAKRREKRQLNYLASIATRPQKRVNVSHAVFQQQPVVIPIAPGQSDQTPSGGTALPPSGEILDTASRSWQSPSVSQLAGQKLILASAKTALAASSLSAGLERVTALHIEVIGTSVKENSLDQTEDQFADPDEESAFKGDAAQAEGSLPSQSSTESEMESTAASAMLDFKAVAGAPMAVLHDSSVAGGDADGPICRVCKLIKLPSIVSTTDYNPEVLWSDDGYMGKQVFGIVHDHCRKCHPHWPLWNVLSNLQEGFAAPPTARDVFHRSLAAAATSSPHKLGDTYNSVLEFNYRVGHRMGVAKGWILWGSWQREPHKMKPATVFNLKQDAINLLADYENTLTIAIAEKWGALSILSHQDRVDLFNNSFAIPYCVESLRELNDLFPTATDLMHQ
jgi:hypothetical protein